jgi:colicin import membrane protein
MMERRRHSGAVLWSVALHAAVIAGLAIGVPWPERPRVAVATAPIQGVIIDQAAIEREREQREQVARAEREKVQRQQREEREQREAVERQRQAEQREKERVASEQRAREEADRKERERVAAEKREQERREQERKEQERREQQARAERERAEKEAAAKREREAAEQRRREAELQAALAVEAERAQAEAAGLLDQYIRAIEQRIKQHWNRPLSARPGVDCVVNVQQLPTGDVVSARVASCNGDDAVRRSIERAVMDASPLPRAPTPAVFERSLNVRFMPDE